MKTFWKISAIVSCALLLLYHILLYGDVLEKSDGFVYVCILYVVTILSLIMNSIYRRKKN